VRKRGFEIGLLFAYACLVATTIHFHEPWRDEAQAWLIARDLDIPGILGRVGAEGSPPLWHFLLHPLARLGLPYQSMHAVSFVMGLASIGLILFASPFARWQKGVLVFSYLMLFEYSVLARSYGLSVMLIFALAALNPRRLDWPWAVFGLLITLALTNLHGLVLAGVIGSFYVWTDWRGHALHPTSLLFLVAVCSLMLAFAILVHHAELSWRPWRFFDHHLVHRIILDGIARWRPRWLGAVMVVPMFIALTRELRDKPAALFLLYAPIAVYSLSPLANFTVHYRHRGFVLLTVIFVLWTQVLPRHSDPAGGAVTFLDRCLARMRKVSAGSLASFFLFACLAGSIPAGVRAVRDDIRGPFSMSQAMADYIDREAKGAVIAAWPASFASSLAPHLPGRSFWYLDVAEWGTFVAWERRDLLVKAEALARLRAHFGETLPWLLIDEPLDAPEELGYRLEHSEAGDVPGLRSFEIYYLYRPSSADPRPQAPGKPHY